jgi:transcriptional regulator GlxA family with amidase domain
MTRSVALIAFDDCHASGVIGPLDLLHTANAVAARLNPGAPAPFAMQILSPDGGPVRPANGYPLPVDGALAEARPEIVVVPGIALIKPKELLAAVERLKPVSDWLAARYGDGAWLAASCSGSFLLAQAGLLEGRGATTTTWFADLFERRYPAVKLDASAVLAESDRLLTSGGAFSYVDLVLRLVERVAGRELAHTLARFVVLDNRRELRTPALIPHHVRHDDPLIRKAEKWMRAQLRNSIGVHDIARHVAVSVRTLVRRFKESTGESPYAYLQRLRLEASKALLATSNYRIDQIAVRVGYQDESAFRRLFKKHVGVSPREYRQRVASR